MTRLQFTGIALGITLALFGAMIVFLEVGREWGRKQVKRRGEAARVGVGVVDGSVYGLLALLIGFTFSGAAERFDARRAIVVKEVDAASTAWLRIDLLPPEQQPAVRDGVRRYLDALIAYYHAPVSGGAWPDSSSLVRAEDELWSHLTKICVLDTCTAARQLLLPAINELFDSVDEERLARRIHPPTVVFVMLFIAAMVSSLFVGYGLASGPVRNWLYIMGFALTVSISTYVILDLEYPRLGLIDLNSMDRALVELRTTMR